MCTTSGTLIEASGRVAGNQVKSKGGAGIAQLVVCWAGLAVLLGAALWV